MLRKTGLARGRMLFFVVVSVCLAVSAFYEIIEWWWAAGFYGEAGPEWLGHQGDPWDAQGDMLMALVGAALALALLSKVHDRSMRRVDGAGSE
jgi:putative membrane protein